MKVSKVVLLPNLLVYTIPTPKPSGIIELMFVISTTITMASELHLLEGIKSFCKRLTNPEESCVQQVENTVRAIRATGNDVLEDDYVRLLRIARQSDAVINYGPASSLHLAPSLPASLPPSLPSPASSIPTSPASPFPASDASEISTKPNARSLKHIKID